MQDWTNVTYNWFVFVTRISQDSRSQWPRVLRRGSAAACLLRLWVRIPPGCMNVCLLLELCVVR